MPANPDPRKVEAAFEAAALAEARNRRLNSRPTPPEGKIMNSTLLPLIDSAVSAELTRCDRCGVAGKTRIVLLSGTDLVFCAHHSREYGPMMFAGDEPLVYAIEPV